MNDLKANEICAKWQILASADENGEKPIPAASTKENILQDCSKLEGLLYGKIYNYISEKNKKIFIIHFL